MQIFPINVKGTNCLARHGLAQICSSVMHGYSLIPFRTLTITTTPSRCSRTSPNESSFALVEVFGSVFSSSKSPATAELLRLRETCVMLSIKTPSSGKARREVEKRAPKLVETGKKTLILHGTKTSSVINQVLIEISDLKKGNCVTYTKKNPNIRPFENGGETSLEFFSLKTDCSIFVFGSHAKKRPHNLVIGRTYDHQIYDLVEVGVENFKSMKDLQYDRKLSPRVGSKPFITFIGEGFENVSELRHLKEVLIDLLRGEVVENLNLAGIDHAYIFTATSASTVFFTHCALRLKKSGSVVPRMELVEVGPSMDFVVRRHRLPEESLRKEAMKTSSDKTKKKLKNVGGDPLKGKIGKIYVPDQQIGEMALPDKSKGVKRDRREAKKKYEPNQPASKKLKEDPEDSE